MSASRRSRSGCLGDRVSRRTAWKIAREHGWETTFDAEYLAVCKLHADALITIDHALAAKAAYIVPLATSRSAGRELIAVDVRTESLAWGQAPMTPTGPQLSRESAVTEAPLRTPEQRPRTSLHLGQLTRPERASVCSTFSTLGGGTEPAHYSASRIWLAHTERAPSSRAALVLREQFVDPRGVDVLLEVRDLAVGECPDVHHLHLGRVAGSDVLPLIPTERHHGVSVGDELIGNGCELIPDLAEAHEHVLHHRLRSHERAREREAVGLGHSIPSAKTPSTAGTSPVAKLAYAAATISLLVPITDLPGRRPSNRMLRACQVRSVDAMGMSRPEVVGKSPWPLPHVTP